MIRYKNLLFTVLFSTTICAFCFYYPGYLYFLNDDFIHIPLSANGKLLQHNFFRPICDFSIMFDYLVWMKNAWGYHLTNLLLHVFNSLLLFFLTGKILRKYFPSNSDFGISITISVLFFVYAMHSEAVFWILGRSAMLGCLFFLPALIFYLDRHKIFYFILSLIMMVLAWSTYESTWILPALAIIISGVDLKNKITGIKKERLYIGWITLLFVFFMCVRYYFTRSFLSDYNFRLINGAHLETLVFNFFKLIFRSFLPPLQNLNMVVFAAAFMTFIAVVLTYSAFKNNFKNKLYIIFIGWFISLLPVVSLGIDTQGTESERFLYIPTLFVCFILVVLIYRIERRVLRMVVIVSLIVFEMIFLYSSMNNYRWASKITFTAISEVEKISNNGNLYVDNLPDEVYGALIFRSGFPDAIKWMKKSGTIDSIKIVSKRSGNFPVLNNYQVIRMDSLAMSMVITADTCNAFQNFRSESDSYLDFKNKALYVYSYEP